MNSKLWLIVCCLVSSVSAMEGPEGVGKIKVSPTYWLRIIEHYRQPLPAPLEALPDELKGEVLLFLTSGKDIQEAAQNIRNFMSLNKVFAPFLNDESINRALIEELARRFFSTIDRVSLIKAATVLGTKGAVDWLRDMLESDPELSKNKEVLFTILAWSGSHTYGTLIPLLIKNGAPLNIQDDEGNTPLMVAIKQDNPDLALYLLYNGAEKYKPGLVGAYTNKKGETVKGLVEEKIKVFRGRHTLSEEEIDKLTKWREVDFFGPGGGRIRLRPGYTQPSIVGRPGVTKVITDYPSGQM